MKIVLSIVTLVLLAVSPAKGEVIDSLTICLQAGDSCMQQYNTFEALKYYQKAYGLRDTLITRTKLADCYYKRANYRQTAELLRIVCRTKPSVSWHSAIRNKVITTPLCIGLNSWSLVFLWMVKWWLV